MWFNRKSNSRKNLEREELMDVKLRASEVRKGRMKVFGAVGAVAALALAIGLGGWRGGRYLLDRFIYKNDTFAIRQIDVISDGIATSKAIRAWAGVRAGDNLLALDLMKVKRDLESRSGIASAAVERILPGMLRLRVDEREPIAQTLITQPRPDGNYEQIIYQFDKAGCVMKPLDARQMVPSAVDTDHLPLLLGVSVADLQPGHQTESAQIRAALQLLSEFERCPMRGLVEIQKVNVSLPDALEVTTSQGAVITFGLDQFDVQLRRWRLINDQFQQWGKTIAAVDLSVSNNLPVRLTAGSVQPINPRPIRGPRTKKRNV